MSKYSKNGRLLIPLTQREKVKAEKKEDKVKYVVTSAYCPSGCSIIDNEYPINGYPGLRIQFKRPGMEGEFIISAIEGDFEKIVLSGDLKDGVKDDLFCPHCGAAFEKLVNCGCQPDSDMVVIGLTPALDFNNSITFCNVTGCNNGAFVESGTIIRHIRLRNGF
ncbi:MAG: hypothetical protein R6W78_02135 [Bacteroidales bacterium]